MLSAKDRDEVDAILNNYVPIDSYEFCLVKNLDQINKCFDAPTVEGIVQNLEKDGSEWAQKTIKVYFLVIKCLEYHYLPDKE